MATKSKIKKTPTSAKASAGKPVKKTVSNKSPLTSFKMKKSHAVSLFIILVVAALIYGLRSFIVAATVNGQPITRLAVVRDAEKRAGKQAIDSLVTNTLIEQEAKKQKVTVTDKEINEDFKKVEESVVKQGQKFDEALALQGLTREDLRKGIRINILIKKMVGKDVAVTDKDVNEYIEQNRETLPTDQTEEQLKKSVKDQLTQQALGVKAQAWLADIQKKAKIQYFVQY